MVIVVYTTATCPFCKMLKDYLSSKSLPFTEKLVDQDDGAREEMVAKSGGYMGVPFTIIQKDNGEEKKIVGFDAKLLDEVLA